MRTLFPEIQPFDTGTLQVDDRHTLYYEQCGNPDGKPVVMLHGGPGAGCSDKMRRFHDPSKYRIVLFDQRGSGRSTPHADLVDNTTWTLVADIPHPTLGSYQGVTRPIRYSRTPGPDPFAAPVLKTDGATQKTRPGTSG